MTWCFSVDFFRFTRLCIHCSPVKMWQSNFIMKASVGKTKQHQQPVPTSGNERQLWWWIFYCFTFIWFWVSKIAQWTHILWFAKCHRPATPNALPTSSISTLMSLSSLLSVLLLTLLFIVDDFQILFVAFRRFDSMANVIVVVDGTKQKWSTWKQKPNIWNQTKRMTFSQCNSTHKDTLKAMRWMNDGVEVKKTFRRQSCFITSSWLLHSLQRNFPGIPLSPCKAQKARSKKRCQQRHRVDDKFSMSMKFHSMYHPKNRCPAVHLPRWSHTIFAYENSLFFFVQLQTRSIRS